MTLIFKARQEVGGIDQTVERKQAEWVWVSAVMEEGGTIKAGIDRQKARIIGHRRRFRKPWDWTLKSSSWMSRV